MARRTPSLRVSALLALLAATPAVYAQADLPNLDTATQATELSTTTDASSTTDSSSTTTEGTTAATSSDSSTTSGTVTATFPDGVTSTTGTGGTPFTGLTDLPTIAGAGIPTMVIPYTANAPFMQKSTMPEGTVFIAVGAVLGFLGACVLLWRGLVAWSINRSVKRNSRTAMGGSEKTPRWAAGGGRGPNKNGYYKEYDMGSSMSLDALNSNGKQMRQSTFTEEGKRQSSAPPAGLFFSPTAQASNRASSANLESRNSSHLPAGYYASPSAEIGGGRGSTVIGASLAPYARNSTVNPSPPGSPNLPGSRSTSNYYSSANPYPTSRDGLRATSREALRAPPSRDGYNSQRNSSVMYHQPSTSSLAVGLGGGAHSSNEYLGGQRAPSAVLDELFENHGNGPRERC